MIRTSFNEGWEFRPQVNPFAELSGPSAPYRPVTVPHDAMIGRQRTASADAAGAFFPGGAYEYRKVFHVAAEDQGKRILVEFEGVYRDAMVYVNGAYVAQRPYGYSQFHVDIGPHLRYGATNEIRVDARTHQDSRWYTGAGIYRDTWLLAGGPVRISPEGVRVTALDTDRERAVVEVAVQVESDERMLRTVQLGIRITDVDGRVMATGEAPVTVEPGQRAVARQRLYIPDPGLWSPEQPTLYTAVITLDDGQDTEHVTFGIRTLQLDPTHGLRLNGTPVKLRGACVHHDNGPLGAATHARAEERRVELLKDAGFNAIRMSHHPMSRAMLEACDRLGMLVVDEAFDMWTSAKSAFDYSLHFADWWERDLEAMVAKDYNHPSVVLYSIGNEILEAGSPAGAVWGRRLAEKTRALDPTRYVTNGINTVLAVMADLKAMNRNEASEQSHDDATGINTLMADLAARMEALTTSELVTRKTEESFSVLDIAGMNYAEARYEIDRELFPQRVILGTETVPTHIDRIWRLVKEHSHVIGDFTWTGWDYLGEVGIGRPQYLTAGEAPMEFMAPFPHLTADCGDIDITGHRRPASYYREILFGLRTDPYLAVRRPQHHGRTYTATSWAWSDSVPSWTWPGFESAPITVEVYGAGDEVELLVNGSSRGRHPLTNFRTEFDLSYEPGELLAVCYTGGTETGRHAIRTAGTPDRLRAECDRPVIAAAGGDLAYVSLTLTDADGTCHPAADRSIRLEVTGSGVLAGFGSARPSTEERFDAPDHLTYEGRALAILRPTGPGEIRLLASAQDCGTVMVRVEVRDLSVDGMPPTSHTAPAGRRDRADESEAVLSS
ncbi:glycoside hydrolase family 2 TIM barrel-domain containing protein [Streptomyces caeruleatus]|uniref:glycoside hydrolase family 2 TIM barrel-domain containing protein n=1 Tax=Streptomyces caeruleatus TaxID=661399 RepID=UPI00099E59A3|nr:glycoside hydrolase family 2 TIM barrel-domain containing protein [Streptomyces caeruleatus]